ncbi:tyrosinase [Dactylonectria estremocensis]|uniref:Tyrosinase n=1 Tax=Dactylonectria estremocensis TaxID=1079267 RepID=A0A9P9EFC0_9HYPO|nr:tyrosinase [Dactylonectria estremocensis]
MLFKFSSVLVWALSAVSLVDAERIPVVGVKSGVTSTNVPYRKNINELYSSGGPQWDLYIRSLITLYKQNPKEQGSFFQVAGIHGKPYVEFNNAGASTSNGWRGYCPHGENLFLPWHRPYLVLFEQRLVATAVKLANSYPSKVRAKYLSAARNLRAPYWDWAAQDSVPTATVPSRLTINIPNGKGGTKKFTVDNPLATYKYPSSAVNGAFGSFDNRPQTYRCRSPQSYPASANSAMRGRPYKSWVYDAFTSSTTFDQFASTASTGVSLEQIHNAIHWDGACGYQFLDADYSAYDPLFMLHHANVDRLWTYWQFIRPSQANFKSSYKGAARFNSREGATITPKSPLQPFFQANGKFHTPESVTSIRGFGYTYWGLEYWKKSKATLTKDATAVINRLYGPSSSSSKKSKRDDQSLTRYFAQIEVNVEELERPCAIGLYVNTTSVGNFIVLMQPASGTFFGKFSLDRAADPVDVADTKTSVVVGDILAGLRVEIKKHDGTIIDLSTVPSLKLELQNADVVQPDSETELPEYSDTKTRPVDDPKQKQPPAQ